MLHIEKTTILLVQFAKNRKSISSKLRPQEEVKNVSSKKKTPCIFVPVAINPLYYACVCLYLD